MSTRATLSVHGDSDRFDIYRHFDGYPDGEHGVIADLQKSRVLAWDPPRIEAGDTAAAIVATMKSGPGSVYLTRNACLHGDRDYHYDIHYADPTLQVAVWDFTARARRAARLFDGPLDDAVTEFESGPVVSERDAVLAQVWEALAGAEYALADMETAQRKGRLPDIQRQVFAAMDAHRAELRAATPAMPETAEPPQFLTRADLARFPGFSDLTLDTSGNPCVWLNFYQCDCGCEWDDSWSCQCDDDCPRCNTTSSPAESTWIGPSTQYDLWEKLPEAGAAREDDR